MCLCKADLPFSLRLRVEEGIRLCPSMIEDSSLGHWQLAMPFQNQKAACRIFMYVCMYVCMYVRIYVCKRTFMYCLTRGLVSFRLPYLVFRALYSYSLF